MPLKAPPARGYIAKRLVIYGKDDRKVREQLQKILQEALDAQKELKSTQELESLRVRILGKKGELTGLLRGMGKLSPEERPAMGQLVNSVREKIETALDEQAARIADAEKQVKLAVGSIQEQTAAEEKRLETAKAATAKFIEAARAICNTQLKNIDSVASGIMPQAAEAEPAVSVDDTVRSIENSASRIQADPSIQIDIPPVKTAPAAPARQRKLDSTQSFSL